MPKTFIDRKPQFPLNFLDAVWAYFRDLENAKLASLETKANE